MGCIKMEMVKKENGNYEVIVKYNEVKTLAKYQIDKIASEYFLLNLKVYSFVMFEEDIYFTLGEVL